MGLLAGWLPRQRRPASSVNGLYQITIDKFNGPYSGAWLYNEP